MFDSISSAMSAEAALDLIGLVERSITVAQALRASLIADYADRLASDEPRRAFAAARL